MKRLTTTLTSAEVSALQAAISAMYDAEASFYAVMGPQDYRSGWPDERKLRLALYQDLATACTALDLSAFSVQWKLLAQAVERHWQTSEYQL